MNFITLRLVSSTLLAIIRGDAIVAVVPREIRGDSPAFAEVLLVGGQTVVVGNTAEEVVAAMKYANPMWVGEPAEGSKGSP